jgi:hypothetical protein
MPPFPRRGDQRYRSTDRSMSARALDTSVKTDDKSPVLTAVATATGSLRTSQIVEAARTTHMIAMAPVAFIVAAARLMAELPGQSEPRRRDAMGSAIPIPTIRTAPAPGCSSVFGVNLWSQTG